MAWADGKAALATLLATPTITQPSAMGIETVFTDAPSRIPKGDLPAFVLYPPGGALQYPPGSWRRKLYSYRARLLLFDADFDVAAAAIESFTEAVIDVCDDMSTVRANGVQYAQLERWDEPGTFTYGRDTYVGVEFHFDIRMGEARTIG